MGTFTSLEMVGDATTGDSTDPNPQTVGGQTDLVFSRTYKVLSSDAKNYLFQILNPPARITDDIIPVSYLVKQRLVRLDLTNCHLICVFAQIPSTWRTDSSYQNVTMPGVRRSSLYAPGDFPFRTAAASISTQVRYEHAYFLGPIEGISTFTRFAPIDSTGDRVSVITDQTDPSADEYISMVNGRREFIAESVVVPWKGDIFDRRTMYAMAK